MLVNLHIPILVDSLLSRFIPPLSLSLPLPDADAFFVAVVQLLKECPSFHGALFKDSVLSVSLPAALISLYFPAGKGTNAGSPAFPISCRHLRPDLAVQVVPQIAVILYFSAMGRRRKKVNKQLENFRLSALTLLSRTPERTA